MKLTLTIQNSGSSLSPFVRFNSGSTSAGQSLGLSNSSLKSQVQVDQATLSNKARKLGQTSDEVSSVSPAARTRPQSVLRGFMNEVSSINSQIAELTKQLGPETLLTADQKTAVNTELFALQTQYTQVVTSDVFKQITDITAQVSQSLSLGGSTSGLVASLGQYRSLLGDDFLGIVQYGDLTKLGNISSGLGTIANADMTSLSTKPGTTDEVAKAIKLVTDALDGGSAKSASAEYAAPVLTTVGTSRATPIETVFYGAGDLAIALKSYSPADMLKLAAAHADIDPISVLMLVAPPREDQLDDTLS